MKAPTPSDLRAWARSWRRSASQMERHRGPTGDVEATRAQAAAWDREAAAMEATRDAMIHDANVVCQLVERGA